MRAGVVMALFGVAGAPSLAASAFLGCAAPPVAGPAASPVVAPALAPAEARDARFAGVEQAAAVEVPDRDPAARGRLAVDMSVADLPDDRDGDGVDQLRLCPELLPDRVDGCPHTR